MSALETAKAKLAAVGEISFQDLPSRADDALWDEIRGAHTGANKLTLGEVSALKNAACAQDGGHMTALVQRIQELERRTSLSSHPRQYDLAAAEDAARGWHAEAKLENKFATPPRVLETIDLFLDTGMIGVDMDLILPYKTVRELGLQETNESTTPDGFGGRAVLLTKFYPVLVSVPLYHPVTKELVERKEAHLDVWSEKMQDVVMEFDEPKDGILYMKPLLCPDNRPLSPAFLGKHGQAKLGLTLDPKNHYLYKIVKKTRV